MAISYPNDPIRRKLFYVQRNMINRCYWKKEIGYKNYGGRGIKVCDRWLHFPDFYADVIGTYKSGLTFDRIDNDGDYTPDNFRWVTRKVQNNNTRRNKVITYKGKTMPLLDWAEYIGVKRSTLAQRIYVYQWPLERALATEGVPIGNE